MPLHYGVSFCTLHHHTRQSCPHPQLPFLCIPGLPEDSSTGVLSHPPLPHPCCPPAPERSRSHSQPPVTQGQGRRFPTSSSAPGLHLCRTPSVNILRSWIPRCQRQTLSHPLLLCWHACSSTTATSQCCSDNSSQWWPRTRPPSWRGSAGPSPELGCLWRSSHAGPLPPRELKLQQAVHLLQVTGGTTCLGAWPLRTRTPVDTGPAPLPAARDQRAWPCGLLRPPDELCRPRGNWFLPLQRSVCAWALLHVESSFPKKVTRKS